MMRTRKLHLRGKKKKAPCVEFPEELSSSAELCLQGSHPPPRTQWIENVQLGQDNQKCEEFEGSPHVEWIRVEAMEMLIALV